jgi:hypothetical protein
VIKFNGVSGAELWRQAINGTANGGDQALAVEMLISVLSHDKDDNENRCLQRIRN